MALEADPAWQGGRYHPGRGPEAGLAAARAIAMITYRASREFDERFGRARSRRSDAFDIETYLRRQGEKLVARFDAAQLRDAHAGDGSARHGRRSTSPRARPRARVRRVIGIGIDTDILYPAADVRRWVEAYRPHVDARYAEIASACGHDAFLIEFDQVTRILAVP